MRPPPLPSRRRRSHRALAILTALACALTAQAARSAPARASAPAPASAPGVVLTRTIRIVEHRRVRLPNGRWVPRTLPTRVWVPAGSGPFPLVVFAHGFDITPAPYAALLTAWAQAGFLVAAPTFPLTRPHAPGGPDEDDILNQPGDLSAVITRLIGASRRAGTPFSGLVDERAIAVAGQSDGGITALLAAYNRFYRDRRVDAAVILSGAELDTLPGWSFGPAMPPLFAAQGTADTTNLPRNTYRFFRRASCPKALLKLIGAGHLPPYTDEQPQLGIVENATTDFLNWTLRHTRGALAAMRVAGRRRGVTTLTVRQ